VVRVGLTDVLPFGGRVSWSIYYLLDGSGRYRLDQHGVLRLSFDRTSVNGFCTLTFTTRRRRVRAYTAPPCTERAGLRCRVWLTLRTFHLPFTCSTPFLRDATAPFYCAISVAYALPPPLRLCRTALVPPLRFACARSALRAPARCACTLYAHATHHRAT